MGDKRGRARLGVLGTLFVVLVLGFLVALAPSPAWAASTVPMYRLYNRWSGEHLFTADSGEYDYLASIGWTKEGVAWQAPTSGDPVWRLYNPYSGDHFYTGDGAEYDHLGSIGWRKEGVSFRSATSGDRVPIYRLFNRWLTAGTHLFTTDRAEYDRLGSIGWSKEGVAFYGVRTGGSQSGTGKQSDTGRKSDSQSDSGKKSDSGKNSDTGGKTDTSEISYKQPAAGHVKQVSGTSYYYVDNQVLLTAKEGVSRSTIEQLVASLGGSVVGCISVTRDYQIEFSSAKSFDDIKAVVSQLRANSSVEAATPNEAGAVTTEMSSDGIPNDSEWSGLGWSFNDMAPGSRNWALIAMQAPKAWTYLDKMSTVKVGVIDSCFDLSQGSELTFAQVWNNPSSVSALRSSGELDHGTFVADIIGATFDNGKGIGGLSPKTTLYGYSILGDNTGAVETADGKTVVGWGQWKYALAQEILSGCKVINVSMGYDGKDMGDEYFDEEAEVFGSFLQRLISTGRDFVIVQGAGNHNSDVLDNGMFVRIGANGKYQDVKDRIIVAGGVDLTENILLGETGLYGPKYSWYGASGDRVDVVAPAKAYAYMPSKSGYGVADGTSISAPYVSGVAALCFSVNRGMTGPTVKKIITSNESHYTWVRSGDSSEGSYIGVVDAYLSVKDALAVDSGGSIVFPAGEAMGQVYRSTQDGKQIASGIDVLAYRSGSDAGSYSARTTTDASGGFDFALGPGTYTLYFKDGSKLCTSRVVTISDGEVTYLDDVLLDVSDGRPIPKKSVELYTWAELSTISSLIAKADSDDEALAVAKGYNLVTSDGKLDGTQTKSFTLTDGTQCSAQIIGFRHDDLSDGSGKAGITWLFVDIPKTHAWNSSNSVAGGWKASELRSYMNGEFYDLLPSDLKAVISTAKKLTNNVGDTLKTSDVTETDDRLWAPSTTEVYGSCDAYQRNEDGGRYSAVLNAEGTQYQLFRDCGVVFGANSPSSHLYYEVLMKEFQPDVQEWMYSHDGRDKHNAYPGWYHRSSGRDSFNGRAMQTDLYVQSGIGGCGGWVSSIVTYVGGVVPGFCLAGASGAPKEPDQPTQQSLANATVSPIPDQTYTGSALEPGVTVTLGGKTLAEGTDYTVSYASNVDAGTASVTVTGKGSYTGTQTVTFRIVQNRVDSYSWAELSRISEEIAAAGSESAAVQVAQGYGLTTSDGRLDGTQVKSFTLTDGTACVAQIIGFRHDDRADGSGKAGITWILKDGVTNQGYGASGSSSTTAGGWEKSNLRSYMNGTFLGLLPADLKSVVLPVHKLTNNTGVTTSASSVTQTTDSIFAPSLREICGDISWWAGDDSCRTVLNAEGTQYKLFSDAGISYNSKSFSLLKKGNTDYGWWTRSPYPNTMSGSAVALCVVSKNGDPTNWNRCNYYGAVVPAFCV